MIYDALTLAVVLLCIVIGYVRGAAKTVVSFVGYIVSFLVSVFLGDLLTQLIYDNFISEKIIDSIQETFTTQAVTTSVELPPFVSFVLKFTGFDYENALVKAIDNAPSTVAIAFETAVKPIIVSVLSFLLTAVIFILVSLLFRLIVRKILMFVFELPVISSINKMLGALCGAVNSVFIISFIAFLLKLLMPYMNDIPYMFCESTIYNSYIFYHFYSGNIFNAIISVI